MALEVWEIDPAHSSVDFSIRHMLISKVHGRFAKWNGTIKMDEENPPRSSVEIHIDVDSIDTHNPERDVHLRSEDFFDVEHYPKAIFRSKSVENPEADHYKVTGELEMHGMTREITLDAVVTGRVIDPWSNHRIGLEIATRFDRTAFGIDWNQPLESGGLLVGNEVDLAVRIEAVRKIETAAA